MAVVSTMFLPGSRIFDRIGWQRSRILPFSASRTGRDGTIGMRLRILGAGCCAKLLGGTGRGRRSLHSDPATAFARQAMPL
ncbi:hypothetical protein RHI9324_01611 [Rhizobium sp. CECT 9324]|nr:hypothetical protein RHI9324_01611 [Rhizobium sp. CECT 9324]